MVERAEGNPFFVEELVRTLIDHGVLERDNGGWTARELPGDLVVPDTVQAVLAARIDLLAPAEKAALQAAAVIGRIFWAGPVCELLEGRADLRVLEERDFIRRRAGSSIAGEREFAFKHALTREVAYGSLTTARRGRLHAGFAAWLERTGGGRDEHAPLLAHHYAEAVRPEDVDLAWPDEEAELGRLRERAVSGCAVPPSSPSDATRSKMRLRCSSRAVELEPSPPAQVRDLAGDRPRKCALFRRQGFLVGDGAGASSSRTTTELTPISTRSWRSRRIVRAGMWGTAPPRPSSSRLDRTARSSCAAPDSAARAKALIARCYADYDKSPEREPRRARSSNGWATRHLRSTATTCGIWCAFVQGDYARRSSGAPPRIAFVDEISDADHQVNIYDVCDRSGRCMRRGFEEARRYAARTKRRRAALHLTTGCTASPFS